MEDYQQRMLDEEILLRDKFDKLASFIDTKKYLELHKDEQDRMSRQHAGMKIYLGALQERINAFKGA